MEPIIYKPSIYKGAGIYKAGAEGGGIAIKESILDMADDWENVGDQFELTNGFTLIYQDKINVNLLDAGIIYSKKLSIVYFSKSVFLYSPSNILRDALWHGGLSLKSNSRFYDQRDTDVTGVYKMNVTNFVFPTDIDRGVPLDIMFADGNPLSSIDWIGKIQYVGPGNPNGISVKLFTTGNVGSVRAFTLERLCFYVTERQ